jgi:hypothetical protein
LTTEDYTFSQQQYEDYLTLTGIINRTGIDKDDVYNFVLKELLDNAVDAPSDIVEVEMFIQNSLLHIKVRNLNDSHKTVFTKSKLDSIFQMDKFTSSKRGLFRISRGALGDALKYCLGMAYALAKELHITIKDAPLTIRTNDQVFNIKLSGNRGVVKEEEQEESDWTEVEVRLPVIEDYLTDFYTTQKLLNHYVLFNTHISFGFTLGDQSIGFPRTQPHSKKWVNSSSAWYYSLTEFESFIDKFDEVGANVYTVVQKLFREGSFMKKSGFENMTMGELQKSARLKKKLYEKLRDAIPKPPQKLSLPFDTKSRANDLKTRLEQRGIHVSSMKYKSKHDSYSSQGVSFHSLWRWLYFIVMT